MVHLACSLTGYTAHGAWLADYRTRAYGTHTLVAAWEEQVGRFVVEADDTHAADFGKR